MITKRINTRALSNTAVSILALGLLAGCAASPTTSGTTPAPVAEVDESLCVLDTADDDADAAATPSATDEADNADEADLSITDKLKNSAKDTVKETATDALSSAAFLFQEDCIASATSVSVTIPDELRTEIGTAAAKALPLDGFTIRPYELDSSKLCAVTVDLNYSKNGLLEEGFTTTVENPPMTEDEIWAELLSEYKAEPEDTAKKVTDKLGESFMDSDYGDAVRVNPASVLSEFETWAKVTTTYVTDQVAWRSGSSEIQYDRAMALRIAVTGAEYLDGDGNPLLEASSSDDESEETPDVADNELTSDALDESSPSAGAYLSEMLTELVVVTDCAADLDDDDARYSLLLPIMGENPDGIAPFRAFAQVDVAITADDEVSVTGAVDGYELDKDGEWVAS